MIAKHTTLDDIHQIEPGHRFDMEWRTYFDLVDDKAALEHYLATYCRTIWHGDTIMGIGGVTPLWDHVGELWICLADEAFEHKAVVARHLIELIATAKEVIQAHRLQITLAPKNRDFSAFIARLGFQHEGRLRSYIRAGEDYELFARVWDG